MPQTLRRRIALLVGVMICVPVMIIAYIVDIQGRDALLAEKSEKLYGATRLLDDLLADAYVLTDEEKKLSRHEIIELLNRRTSPLAEKVVNAYPGLGAGYYHRGLDVMITYAPTRDYGYVVGQPISKDHMGRYVMEANEPVLAYGSQVRGNIMNSMKPIERNGEVVGYVWANEFYDSVQLQMARMDWSVMAVMAIGLLISLVFVFFLSRNFGREVDQIKGGLLKLEYDLGKPLPELRGELGEIAVSANKMASALMEARSLNENILSSTGDGVLTIDNDLRVTMINPAAQRIIGFAPEEILHRSCYELFPPSEDTHSPIVIEEGFLGPLLDTLRNGTKYTDIEIDYPLHNRMVHLMASTDVIRNAQGENIGAAIFMRDISQTKNMMRHMERAEQLAALGELVAGVAHEVRNPLTAIRGFVQFLDEGASPDERKEYTGIILKEVDSINRVIRQLLSFARPTPQHYQMAKLGDLVKDALVLVKTRNVSGRIEFILDIDENEPEVEIDGELIKQVLLNLLLNAVQAIETQGTVTVSGKQLSADEVEIRISDDGCGISKRNREKIFAPFYTTKPTGTGLGLSIVHRIVTGHNGEIDIESVEGQGTTVILRFPIKHKEV
ncbi:two-component system sensor histidine kinase AtoS [Microvirga sp. W0021]|uniref:histidine kinase n=1 Tax=Hohaiivirga grylli TaxID=3133970 RepID=A0ABV0BKX1_9HYPH